MRKGENYVLVYTENNHAFNPFHATGLFQCPLKETSDMKWLNNTNSIIYNLLKSLSCIYLITYLESFKWLLN